MTWTNAELSLVWNMDPTAIQPFWVDAALKELRVSSLHASHMIASGLIPLWENQWVSLSVVCRVKPSKNLRSNILTVLLQSCKSHASISLEGTLTSNKMRRFYCSGCKGTEQAEHLVRQLCWPRFLEAWKLSAAIGNGVAISRSEAKECS